MPLEKDNSMNTKFASLYRVVAVVAFALVFAGGAQAQTRIALTQRSNVSTSEVGKNLDKHCPTVVLTEDSGHADFLLEAWDTGAGAGRKPYKFTVFAPNGDRVFSTEAARIAGAVEGVCRFVESKSK